MTTLYCDLDSTLIYSHRKTINVKKRVVERLNGRDQSFMTEQTYLFLKSLSNTQIVPVTTRSLDQFLRLKDTMTAINCKNAIIYNGAVLLRNWSIDTAWLIRSRELAAEAKNDMQIALSFFDHSCKALKKCSFEHLFCYASVENPMSIAQELRMRVNESVVDVFHDSRKVYCSPKAINKGAAVIRFSKMIGRGLTIGIGDSTNDLPMLNHVNIPIAPEQLLLQIKNRCAVGISENEILSDAACDIIDSVLACTQNA